MRDDSGQAEKGTGSGDHRSPASGGDPSRKRAAEVLRARESEIMERWERTVREQVEAARDQEKLLLRDQLAPYLDTIIELLESSSVTSVRDEGARAGEFDPSANRSHGRLRATLRGYTLDQVLAEYMILRRTITDMAEEHGLLDSRVQEVVTAVNEQAVLHASLEFTATLHRVRKKSVSMLMHDMRQPLNNIGLMADAMDQIAGSGNQTETGKMAGRMRQQIYRMDGMLSEVLDAVRLQAGQVLELKPERCDVIEELNNWLKGARLAHPDRVELEAPESLEMDFDPAALSRAVENLVGNAFKYGDPEEKVKVSVEANDDRVWLSIHNWGEPIDDREKAQIFVAFEQAEDKADTPYVEQGWGLGLTYVQAVAQGLGGDIQVESSEEDGTTFILELPRWQAA